MSELARKLIQENKKTKVKFLDLGNCGIDGAIPEEIGDCFWVEELLLSESGWDWNGENLSYWPTRNTGASNKIKKLPKSLSRLTKLNALLLGSKTRKSALSNISILGELTNLSILDISNTSIKSLEPIASLKNLQVLFCRKTSLKDLLPLAELNELRILDCQETKIQDITPLIGNSKMESLIVNNTAVSDLAPITDLLYIEVIEFDNTKISNIYPISKLRNLRSIRGFNSEVSDLSSVDWSKLQNLKSIALAHTQIHDISPLLPLLKRGLTVERDYSFSDINLKHCPLTVPPDDVVRQGHTAILKYFEEKDKQGEERLYEAKIVIVGAGESGKTTLVKKLFNPVHRVPNFDDKKTEGIKINHLDFRGFVEGSLKPLRAYIWDFGGQEIYHTTHQLFLTPDTLYILLNDNRRNDTDFYYWLNVVSLRAGDKCPILMVFNAKDSSPRQIMPGEDLYREFSNLIENPLDIDFASKDASDFEKLKANILGHFTELKVLAKTYPRYWVHIRDTLAELPDEYISFTQFKHICERHEIKDVEQMRIIAQTLYNKGAILYFPNVFGLDDLIILKSQWCIDAIYSVLDEPSVMNRGGRFDKAILIKKWSGNRYAGMYLQLLQLMQHFDLCYQIAGTNDFIAPQLLPLKENKFTDFSKSGLITFCYDYTFMPDGIMTRAIARLSNFIKAPYVWRSGVTLEWVVGEESTVAEMVENQYVRQIVIKISGCESQRRLYEIRKVLHDIHKGFKGLRFGEKLACNCADCIKSNNPTLFQLNELKADAICDDSVTCRNVNRKKIPAKQILQGLEYYDQPRIFISYSHKNEVLKDEFRTMIAPLEKTGGWKVWDDQWLLPGDLWNDEIMRHLSEANVIVLMLTKEFFASTYIRDNEMSKAIERHERGEALLIGIIVSDCMWEDTPLRKIQLLPKNALAIDKHQNRDEVWKNVASVIKKAITVNEGFALRKVSWQDYFEPFSEIRDLGDNQPKLTQN